MREWSPIDVLPGILDDVPDLVLAYTSDGRYLYANHAAAAFLGSSPMEIVGYHWRELGYSAEVMEPLIKRVEIVGRTGRAEHYRARSSAERGRATFDISLTPLWSDEGNVLAVLAIAHDVSEFFGPPAETLA